MEGGTIGDGGIPGDAEALFDRGAACSTGSGGAAIDCVAAHKWFNLAALAGHPGAARCRAEIAADMTAVEIIEAQCQARTLVHGRWTMMACD